MPRNLFLKVIFAFFRCVPSQDCKQNQIVPRSFLTDYLTTKAEDSTCSDKTHVCCQEANIKRNCSDYAPDGYQCTDESEYVFERELALLVALQVLSSKEEKEEGEEENFLTSFNKPRQ